MGEITKQISLYTGVVPNKDAQTPSEFSDAADDFVAQMEAWPEEYNQFAGQANTLRTDVNAYKDSAETAEANAETAWGHAHDWATAAEDTQVDDGVNPVGFSAYHWVQKTVDWATAAEDTQVNDGVNPVGFSAYHWAQKTARGERLTATSSSSVTIGTGSKTFILNESYRAFTIGSKVRVSDRANPAVNYMIGTVTSYNDSTDELVIAITTIGGSGTISDWAIGLHAGGDADTVNGYSLDQDVTQGSAPIFDAANFTGLPLDTIKANIAINAFRIAVNGGLSVQNMVDGFVDEYKDESGISSKNSFSFVGNCYVIFGVAWDLSTASYDSVSFNVSSQDSNPLCIAFKPDGTKMYMVGNINDTIYQYSLSTAWDLSTASYDSVSFDISSQNSNPRCIAFKPDGTKMYMVGDINNTIYQYSLSTAWDLSTASYDSVSFDVSSQNSNPNGIAFKPDGTKMYMSGISGRAIYQYSLMEPTPPSATLISTTEIANSEPSNAFGVLQEEDIDSVTLNTDILFYASRDGGTTYTQGTLSEEATVDAGRILTATVDLSGQPSGTSLRYKVEMANSKLFKLHATALQWS